ncbi:hypothetical protein [Hyphomicrobium sp. CS1GBMeth3]|uniref:hypothetical protein n=1 Tax=Hyphomicrobium sp. CS1GBMeth3 TaxID=1892845 RepID=UPI000931CFA5|nr:hypothetical protein [Hyphomicrobium sp. CS1GBMeth3]
MRKVCIGFFVALTLSACAGRIPQPTPLALASDPQLDCDAIKAETTRNNRKISDLAIEQSWKMGQNAVAGIVGFMVWPAWLGMDLQNAAGKEAHALSQRNEYLLSLASDRCEPTTQTAHNGSRIEPFMSPLATSHEILSGVSFTSH